MSKVQNVPEGEGKQKTCKNAVVRFRNEIKHESRKLPVRPMPALQCTTTGGPPGGPVQSGYSVRNENSCLCFTCAWKSNMADADFGTPKSGQLM